MGACAEEVLACKPQGFLCCNDRLAQGVMEYAKENNRKLPPLLGHDDAPITHCRRDAAHRNRNAQQQMVDLVVETIRQRLRNAELMARH